jgi:hypothetical protein
MPSWALCGLDGGASPIGGSSKWDNGSATPQKIRPIPMPVANIMEIQETVLNSGRSSSRPNLIRPNRDTASSSIRATNPAVTRT